MGIHARYYPSDYRTTWGYQSYESTREPIYQTRTNSGTSRYLDHDYRNDIRGDIAREVKKLRQENAGLALQLGVNENLSGHDDILEEFNRLRLMNMRLKRLQTKRRCSNNSDIVKTKPGHFNSSPDTTAREYSGNQQHHSETRGRGKHQPCKDPISTKDIFDRVDKLEQNVKKIIKRFSRSHHQYRDNEPTFHDRAVSHIVVEEIAESFDQHAAWKTTSSYSTTTTTSVNTFEAEAKRIIAEYRKSKEQRRTEITKDSANGCSVPNQVRHRQAGLGLSQRHSEGQKSAFGCHTRNLQGNLTQSSKPMYSTNEDQFYEPLLRKTEQGGSESRQNDFDSLITSADTCRSDYTEKDREQQINYGDYAVRNFQHIDEPIRYPQVRSREEKSRLPNSEDSRTCSCPEQTNDERMLLIVRPTRSLSGNVIGYDVAEDIPRKKPSAYDDVQPIGDLTEESCEIPRVTEQEIPLKLDTPFKFVLPTFGGKSVAEVKYNNSLSLSMAREWRSTEEDDKEPTNQPLVCESVSATTDDMPACHVPPSLVRDTDSDSVVDSEIYCHALKANIGNVNTETVTDEETDFHEQARQDGNRNFDTIAEEETDCSELCTRDCNGNIESVTDENTDRSVPVDGVCNGDIESSSEEEKKCILPARGSCNENIESSTDADTDRSEPVAGICNGNIESATEEEIHHSVPAGGVCNGNIETATDKEKERNAICSRECNRNIASTTDMETVRSGLARGPCNEKVKSATEEDTDHPAPCKQVCNGDIEYAINKESDCQELSGHVSDIDILSVTGEEAECHALTTEVCKRTAVQVDEVSSEEPMNSEYDSGPRCRDLNGHGEMESTSHSDGAKTTKNVESVCWGTDEDKDTSGTKSAWCNIGNEKISAKGTYMLPFADHKNEDNFGFPVTDNNGGFAVREVEVTQVTRFHISDSDSSCIDWSGDEKRSGSTDKCVIPDCDTKIKKELEKKTSYPDWDKDSDDNGGSRKDVEDILLLHENHIRWTSSSSSDISKRNEMIVAPTVGKLSGREFGLFTKSSKENTSNKDNVLDIVGNLTSGSDWDSDEDSETQKIKVHVQDGKGTCNLTHLPNESSKEETEPVNDKKKSNDSDWDSESEISGHNKEIEIHVRVGDKAQDTENPKPKLDPYNPSNEQKTPAEMNTVVGKKHTSASDSDWDSESDSLLDERKTPIVKVNLSITDILTPKDDQKKQSPGTEPVNDKAGICDSDWDSESEISGDNKANWKTNGDPIMETQVKDTNKAEYTENLKPTLDAHDPSNEQKTAVDMIAVVGKKHTSASDSDWDSDSDSLLDERKTPVVKHDLSITDLLTPKDDQKKQSAGIIMCEPEVEHCPKKERELVNDESGRSDSDWDSESEISGDNKANWKTNGDPKMKTQVRDTNKAEYTENLKPTLDAHGPSNEQKTHVEMNAVVGKKHTSASDSDWDSDSDSLLDKRKTPVFKCDLSITDILMPEDDQKKQSAEIIKFEPELENFPKDQRELVNDTSGSHDSDWDSESEISGDHITNWKTNGDPEMEKQEVADKAQDTENLKPKLNAQAPSNEQKTHVEMNTVVGKKHTSASDSDWDSESDSLLDERKTQVVKHDLSITDILMPKDDQKKQSAEVIMCEPEEENAPNEKLEPVNDKSGRRDSYWDSESEISGDHLTYQKTNGDAEKETQVRVADKARDTENPKPKLNADDHINEQKTHVEMKAVIEKQHISTSDSDWDSDSDSLLEKMKTPVVRHDRSLTDILMPKHDQKKQSTGIIMCELEEGNTPKLETEPMNDKSRRQDSDWDSESEISGDHLTNWKINCDPEMETQVRAAEKVQDEENRKPKLNADDHINEQKTHVEMNTVVGKIHTSASDSDWDSDSDSLLDERKTPVIKHDLSITDILMLKGDQKKQSAEVIMCEPEEETEPVNKSGRHDSDWDSESKISDHSTNWKPNRDPDMEKQVRAANKAQDTENPNPKLDPQAPRNEQKTHVKMNAVVGKKHTSVSDSDWDSDSDSLLDERKTPVIKHDLSITDILTPKDDQKKQSPGIIMSEREEENVLKEETELVNDKSGSRDSDWDSESKISGDHLYVWKSNRDPKMETQVRAADKAQETENPKPKLNAHDLSKEQKTPVDINTVVGKQHTSASDSDWDSDSDSLLDERKTPVVKVDLSITDILMSKDDKKKKQSAEINMCKPEERNSPIFLLEKKNTQNVPTTVDSQRSTVHTPSTKDVTKDEKNDASGSDWDSDDSELIEPENIAGNEWKTTVQEIALQNYNEDTSSMVEDIQPLKKHELEVGKISTSPSVYKPDRAHDPGGVGETLLGLIESQKACESGSDWDSDTDDSGDKKEEGALFHDDLKIARNQKSSSDGKTDGKTAKTKDAADDISSDEDFSIPCMSINLSDNISGLRKEHNLSSDGDFQDYNSTDEDIPDVLSAGVQQTRVVTPNSSGPCRTNVDPVTDFALKAENSEGFRGYSYEDSSDENMPTNLTKMNLDFKDDNQTENIPRFRKDHNLSSDGDFQDYCSTDEDIPDVLLAGVKQNRVVIPDSSGPCRTNVDPVTDVALKAQNNEGFRGYSYEDSSDENLPTNLTKMDLDFKDDNLRDNILGLRKDHNLSSDGDFQDYSSSDEDIPDFLLPPDLNSCQTGTGGRSQTSEANMAAMASNLMRIVMKEASDSSNKSLNESNNSRGHDTSPRYDRRNQDTVSQGRSRQDSVGEISNNTILQHLMVVSSETTGKISGSTIRLDDGDTGSNQASCTSSNEQFGRNQSRKAPEDSSSSSNGTSNVITTEEADSQDPQLKTTQRSRQFTAKYLSKRCDQEPPNQSVGIEKGVPHHLGSRNGTSNYQYIEETPKQNVTKDKYLSTQQTRDLQRFHDVKIKKECTNPPHTDVQIRAENVKRSTLSKRFTAKYLSKKEASVGSNIPTIEQINDDDAKTIQRCKEALTNKERHYTAKYLARHNTAPEDTLSSSSGTSDVITTKEADDQDPQLKASQRNRQFTAKYLSKRCDQEPQHRSDGLEKDVPLHPGSRNGTSYYIEEGPKQSVTKGRYFTSKYLSTHQKRDNSKDGPNDATSPDTLGCRMKTPCYRSEDNTYNKIADTYHLKETSRRDANYVTDGKYHRRGIKTHGTNCS